MIYTFEVLGPPQPKERARAWGGRHVTPEKTRNYERLVGAVASLRRPPDWLLDGSYRVEVHAYFADRRPRDVDNVAKSVLDGLNGVLWRDDRQVVRIASEKHVDRLRPRAEVRVELIVPEEPTKRLYALGQPNERRRLNVRRAP